jgi:hypothetical protein
LYITHSENIIIDNEQIRQKSWKDIALAEHASIASFARFTLQLMIVGAPEKFVELSQVICFYCSVTLFLDTP